MTGIVGLVSADVRPAMSAELDGMIQLLRRNEKLTVDRLIGDQIGMAAVALPGDHSLANRDGVTLVFFGELYNPAELEHRLLREGRPCASGPVETTADLLIEQYLSFGWQGLAGLNGLYAAAIWDEAHHQLHLLTDRIGSINLYYAETGGLLLFASEYKAIAWHTATPRQVDELGLATFFLYDQVMGNQTLMSGVFSAPPAAHITWQAGRTRVETYGDFSDFLSEASPRPEEEILEGFSYYIRQAVRRLARPDSLLLLTSGLDSRLVAESFRAEAPHLELRTATVGLPDSPEALVAALVAERLGYHYTRLPIDSSYLVDNVPRGTWRSEGKLSAYATWVYEVEPFVEENGLAHVYTGLNGNTLTGRHYPAALMNAKTESEAIEALIGAPRSRLDDLARVMRPEVFRRVGAAGAGVLAENFRRAAGPDVLARYDHQYYNNFIHRAGGKWDVFGDAAHPLDPLMDLDLVRFSLSVPTAQKAGKHLALKLSARYFPLTRGLPLGRTGRSPNLDSRLEAQPVVQQTLKRWRALLRKVNRVRGSDPSYAYVKPGEAMRAGSREYLLDTLARADLLADLFSMSAVQHVINEHLTGQRQNYRILSSLLTFAVWREQFCLGISPGSFSQSCDPAPVIAHSTIYSMKRGEDALQS